MTETFNGYRRADGTVGVRNYLAVISLIQATPWYTQWKKARQAKKSA